VNIDRAPVNGGRTPEDDDGATVYSGRATAKPGSLQKSHGNFAMIALVCIKTLPPLPFSLVLHKDYSENHHELLI
jgi:hypothetical protein